MRRPFARGFVLTGGLFVLPISLADRVGGNQDQSYVGQAVLEDWAGELPSSG